MEKYKTTRLEDLMPINGLITKIRKLEDYPDYFREDYLPYIEHDKVRAGDRVVYFEGWEQNDTIYECCFVKGV